MLSCHLLVLLCILLPCAWSTCNEDQMMGQQAKFQKVDSARVCLRYVFDSSVKQQFMVRDVIMKDLSVLVVDNSIVDLKSKIYLAEGCRILLKDAVVSGHTMHALNRSSIRIVSASVMYFKQVAEIDIDANVIISERSVLGRNTGNSIAGIGVTVVGIDVGLSANLSVTGSSTVNANGHIAVGKSSKFKVEGESKVEVGLGTRYGGNITIGVKSALVADGSEIAVAESLIIGNGGNVSAHGANITADGSIRSNGSIHVLSAQLFSSHVNTGADSKLNITDANVWAKSINISTGSKLEIAKSILINKTTTPKETTGELSTGRNSELILASQSQQVCVALEKIQLSEDSLLHVKISADHCGNVVNVLVEKNTECHIEGKIQRGDLSGPGNSLLILTRSIVTDRVKCKVRFTTTTPTTIATSVSSNDSHPTTTPSSVPTIMMWTGIASRFTTTTLTTIATSVSPNDCYPTTTPSSGPTTLMWTGIALAIIGVLIGLVTAGGYFYCRKKNDETTRGTAAATRVQNKNVGQDLKLDSKLEDTSAYSTVPLGSKRESSTANKY